MVILQTGTIKTICLVVQLHSAEYFQCHRGMTRKKQATKIHENNEHLTNF